MRAAWIAIAALAVWLGAAGPVRAGVYSTVEPLIWPVPAEDFKRFQHTLGDLRAARVQEQSPQRAHYLKQAALLEVKERTGAMTVDDRINLSAYFIYLGKPEDAVRVLEAVPAEQRNFMVLANLATAHHMADRLDRAISYQEQVLKAWPWLVAEWSADQRQWYPRAEKFYLKLLRLRYPESLRQPVKPWETVDALFPGVRFVGPSGRYEAGDLAIDQRTELPPDAMWLVVQLVLWLPADDRLFWLLGELLNAKGNLAAAERILDELVYARGHTGVRELMDHRRIIVRTKKTLDAVANDMGLLLYAVAPRGGLQPPGVGVLAYEGGWNALVYFWPRRNDAPLQLPPDAPPDNPASPLSAPARSDWLPDWRHMTVAFGAGAVVTLLAQMQLREYRRRRQGVPVESRG